MALPGMRFTAGRLRALDALAAGDLRPVLPATKPPFAVGAPKPTPPSLQALSRLVPLLPPQTPPAKR